MKYSKDSKRICDACRKLRFLVGIKDKERLICGQCVRKWLAGEPIYKKLSKLNC